MERAGRGTTKADTSSTLRSSDAFPRDTNSQVPRMHPTLMPAADAATHAVPALPIVPVLTPEVAAIVVAKRKAAIARRQARLLSNAPVVNVHVESSQDSQPGHYTVAIPGLIPIAATSSTRSRFCIGRTTHDQAKAATAAAVASGTQATFESLGFRPRSVNREHVPISDPFPSPDTTSRPAALQSTALLGRPA
jgi:hypothetical protein